MTRVAAIAALGGAVLLLALAACGGGGSSSSASAPSTAGPSSRTVPTIHEPSRAARRQARVDRRVAGRAAPFVRPASDNSIPTFGAEAGAAERAAVEASLKHYLRARAGEDWTSVCRGLAKGTREGFEKLARTGAKGCAPVLAALAKEADLADPLVAGLLSLRVKGRNAFALFYGPGPQQYFMPLLREGDRWKPTQSGPIEYPPGASG